jgi:hypothetical protein
METHGFGTSIDLTSKVLSNPKIEPLTAPGGEFQVLPNNDSGSLLKNYLLSESKKYPEVPFGGGFNPHQEIRTFRSKSAPAVLTSSSSTSSEANVKGPLIQELSNSAMGEISSSTSHQPYSENIATYSEEKINISDDYRQTIEIPKKGTFQAGSKLLSEISDELFYLMCDSLTGDKKLTCLTQFQTDISRCTEFNVKDEKGTRSIKHKEFQDIYEIEMLAIKDLCGFLEAADLINAIGSIANQTLTNMLNLLYSGQLVSSAEGKKSAQNTFVNFSSEGAIGFPSPGAWKTDGSKPYLGFEIEKSTSSDTSPFFLLTCNNDTGSVAFFLKNKDGENGSYKENEPSEVIVINDRLKQTCVSRLQIKIMQNSDFNPNQNPSKENAPCHLACIELSNQYEVFEASSSKNNSIFLKRKGVFTKWSSFFS